MVADDTLRRTPLFERHVALGARIIPFAGWEMPVQYTGIIAEHNAVRNQAGLFDLGHMGQVSVTGRDALAYLQATTTNDVSTLQPGEAQYAMLPNEQGGVIDDILIYRSPDGPGYMVVVNASNRFRDVAWMQAQHERLKPDVSVVDISDRTAMIAIQGPNAAAITQAISGDDLSDIAHYHWRSETIAGVPVMIARTGYTGEDGFEIYGPIDEAGVIWDALMGAGKELGLQPIGLGARDTLRLEARMPLYGQELGDDISPYEAGLGWAVKLNKGDFVGREGMVQVKVEGVKRKAVGFHMTERGGAPRTHYPVGVDGKVIGEVTSGAFSPTLGENIGLALIAPEFAGIGKPLQVEIRGKWVNAEQIKMPFYKRSGQ
jgi:glycine cleavage system T protein (aminomethyltransferase)